MNDNVSKSKLKMQDIITEITNLKKYNSELMSNSKGEKLETYLNKLNNSIIEAQNRTDDIYNNVFK